jgi:hypothetical protein
MWLINTAVEAESPFTFRILPGAIKTIGRAPRADFIVEAALVSRLHCQLTAGAADLEVVDLANASSERFSRAATSSALARSSSSFRGRNHGQH